MTYFSPTLSFLGFWGFRLLQNGNITRNKEIPRRLLEVWLRVICKELVGFLVIYPRNIRDFWAFFKEVPNMFKIPPIPTVLCHHPSIS